MQSDAVGFAYRSWRREWGGAGKRKCGGVLVWQFNDTWPTMSWAVVDYFLVKKPAFYMIKRCMEPVVVGVSRPFHEWTSGHCDPTVALRDRRCDLWVSNLTTENVTVDVTMRAISIKSGKNLYEDQQRSVFAKANTTTEIKRNEEIPLGSVVDPDANVPFNTTEQWEPYIIHATLLINGRVLSTDTAWPQPIKYLSFSDRSVKVALSNKKDEITISAAKPVHGFVFQKKRDWVTFSDNGFDVVPGEEVVVQILGGTLEEGDLRWSYIGAEGGEIGFGDARS